MQQPAYSVSIYIVSVCVLGLGGGGKEKSVLHLSFLLSQILWRLEVELQTEISHHRRGGTFHFLSVHFGFEKFLSFTGSVFMQGKALGGEHYQN